MSAVRAVGSPRPWRVEEEHLDENNFGYVIVDANDDVVCDLYEHGGMFFTRYGKDAQNAELIVAAINSLE